MRSRNDVGTALRLALDELDFLHDDVVLPTVTNVVLVKEAQAGIGDLL